ncbi:hypothetical protein NCCP1664_20110 [Zafaria cholistanensis]|uniref:Uncharacterized protein n=1 Tax=Zafaria cholistanensis TaxID=1682741 RepID=A0A5A7NSA2_9MICC|nr:hypothetical protein [Zafaria cholistanensis]GER23516.1 hypothetical protein NCCP1664_20110 [Zafaria cholistanensis]
MSIARLYRRDAEGVLEFREAWFEAEDGGETGQFVVNRGIAGHQSKTEEVKDVAAEAGEALLDAFVEQCLEDGYAEIRPEDQHWVIAQFALKSVEGTQRDRYLEAKAAEALRGFLGWRGLGTVESTDFAPRKLNIRILSPEPAKAVAAVRVCIKEADLDVTKLSIGVAPYSDLSALKQKHPLPAKAPFTLD